jgi:hypothetical protein
MTDSTVEPFDAHTYYMGLRAIGANPHVVGDGLGRYGEYLRIAG